jgi:tRNA pseudouridine38-40 synthase
VPWQCVGILEYDGTRYYGFQLQASQPTIQGELELALSKLTGAKVRVRAASRTDTGVHAKGQVISFRTSSSFSPQTFVNGLNYYLPDDIAVKAAYRVDDSFNVRRNAVSREYNYRILNNPTRSPLSDRFCHLVAGYLDIEAMNRACQVLVGVHDFTSFASSITPGEKSMVRRVHSVTVAKDNDLVVIDMVANAFVPHQVRNTVGALLRVGQGKIAADEFYRMLEAKRPGLAGPSAPARGLCLMRVNYPTPFNDG